MNSMGRAYHLSKKITPEQAEKIVNEMRELENVEAVEITEDGSYLKVATEDGQFSEVMGKAVNICSRIARGTELSFANFVIKE